MATSVQSPEEHRASRAVPGEQLQAPGAGCTRAQRGLLQTCSPALHRRAQTLTASCLKEGRETVITSGACFELTEPFRNLAEKNFRHSSSGLKYFT